MREDGVSEIHPRHHTRWCPHPANILGAVTSLTAGAISLFSGDLGCLKGQSSPKDVPSGVFVGLGGVPALSARELHLTDSMLFRYATAGFAAIRRVAGVDLDPDAPSVFRFDAQDCEELPPPCITNTSVQPSLGCGSTDSEPTGMFDVRHRFGAAQHIADLQILHHYQSVGSDEFAGQFVVKIPALIGNFSMPASDRFAPAAACGRPTLRASQPLLRLGQPCRSHTRPAGILDAQAVRGGYKTCDAEIDPRLFTVSRQSVSGYFVTREDQHPMPTLAAYLDRLDSPHDFAVRCDFDPPNALQIHTSTHCVPSRAVAILRPLDRIEAIAAFETRKSSPDTVFHLTKEPVKCSIQPAESGLLARERPRSQVRAHLADLTQLSRLIHIHDAGLGASPRVASLLQRGVIQLSVGLQASIQQRMLSRRRSHTKFVGPPHATSPRPYSAHCARGGYQSRRATTSTRDLAISERYMSPPTTTLDEWPCPP